MVSTLLISSFRSRSGAWEQPVRMGISVFGKEGWWQQGFCVERCRVHLVVCVADKETLALKDDEDIKVTGSLLDLSSQVLKPWVPPKLLVDCARDVDMAVTTTL